MQRYLGWGLLLAWFTLPAWAADCAPTAGVDDFRLEGWGYGPENHRFQSRTSITPGNVGRMRLSWAFAMDEGLSPHSYPLVTEDTLFIGTVDGTLYALDRETGCVRWSYSIDDSIRTGLAFGPAGEGGPIALYFGTGGGELHAVRADNGQALWVQSMRSHPSTMLTGTPRYSEGSLYVPLSSSEVGLALSPFYACCTSSGGLRRVVAETGEVLWHVDTIGESPQVTGHRWVFVEQWGPAGAPVWSSPAEDDKLGLVFIGTGQNYSHPTTTTSDAILAVSKETGELRWTFQATAGDAFNMACGVSESHPNCPSPAGPDVDFGAPPVLTDQQGITVLLAGQKSGDVHALNAASGELIWRRHLGRGGYLGGVHWGMALDEANRTLYVPLNDIDTGPAHGEPAEGLHALDAVTGEVKWRSDEPAQCGERSGCRTGYSAAVVAAPGLVFAGVLDGSVFAFDAAGGDTLWSFDSWRDYPAVNGGTARGGPIDVHGPLLADHQLIVQSGYGSFGQSGGNALLVFTVEEGDDD